MTYEVGHARGGTQKEIGALSKDSSTLKDVVGTTDPEPKEHVAKGSAFVVGGKVCKFKEGGSGSHRGVRYGRNSDHH
jgi:hypothetical protein